LEPPEKPEEDEPFTTTGPTLDAEGNLESKGDPASRAHRSSVLRPQPVSGSRELNLELEERPRTPPLELEATAPRAEADYVPPPAPAGPGLNNGPSGWPILLVLVLGLLGAGAWYYFFASAGKGPPPRHPIAITITITSEPNGAAVSVEGTKVGLTPWAVDNTWGPGPVHVIITLPGYRPWSGTFPGGQPARLEARLQRR
jgi:serine/threonine-protein kinase